MKKGFKIIILILLVVVNMNGLKGEQSDKKGAVR